MNGVLTISELLCFQLCPSLWAYRYHAMRRPRHTPSSALDRGQAVHAVLKAVTDARVAPASPEGWTELLQQAYTRELLERGAEPSDQHEEELRTLAHGLLAYWRRHHWEGFILASEKTLMAEFVGHMYAGRLDALVHADGGLWHRQYKTFSRIRTADGQLTADTSAYLQVIARSLHEAFYRQLVETHYPKQRYLGTQLVLFGLDSLHARGKGEKCAHCGAAGLRWRGPTLLVEPIRLRDELVRIRNDDIHRAAYDIQEAHQALQAAGWPECGGPPPLAQHEHACWNRGRLCGYIGVCDARPGASVLDALLWEEFDPMARYGGELDDLLTTPRGEA